MYYNLLFLAIVSSFISYDVIGIPLISNGFNGLFNHLKNDSSDDSSDESETVEAVSNEFSKIQDPNLIDLSIYGRILYGHPDFNKTGHLVAKFKPAEALVNPEELGSYLEGDILVPQKSLILKSGLSFMSYRWPNGEVPFEIAGHFSRKELDVINFAINEYHMKTCIRFKPHATEADYISIVNGNSGCWSSIGRVGGKQQVNLQTPGCLIKRGTVIHELMHVLGFLHEQNRKERNSYVDIQYQNIQKNAITNFQRVTNTIAFGVEYDYGSVMHYSPIAFSSNGQPTILARKPLARQVMGQRKGFSPLDIEKINRMYNCKINSKPPPPSRFSFE